MSSITFRTAISSVRSLGHELLDLIAPRECAACLAVHPTQPVGSDAPPLCRWCFDSLAIAENPPDGVTVPYEHGGPLAQAIHRAKYGNDPWFAAALGRLLAHSVRSAPDVQRCDCIVAVPLHRHRLAKRGFNQAVELARGFARPICFGAVVRVRDTTSQVGLSRQDRASNVADAFALNDCRSLRGRNVLVVDDVVTTGATLSQVVATVRKAQPASVAAVALARAPLDGR